MSERITVFDIEILNNDPTSICSIGIVLIKDRKIQKTFYSLIRPYNLSFDKYRFGVHHIRPQALAKERYFKDVWPEIAPYFERAIVVSHDVQNDMAHMRACFKQNHIPYPTLIMSCTNVLSHLYIPGLEKYNIQDLCAYYHTTVAHPHNALSDAKACATILTRMMHDQHCQTIEQLHKKKHLDFGIMRENYYHNIISPDLAIASQHALIHPLSNKSIVFTGNTNREREEIEKMTRERHAFVSRDVNSHTDYLVIGDDTHNKNNNKIKKARKLLRMGQDLRVISEKDYLALLGNKAHQ